MKVTCGECGKVWWEGQHEFQWRSRKSKSGKLFCSRECTAKFMRVFQKNKFANWASERVTGKCHKCGGVVELTPGEMRARLKKSVSGNIFCSLDCSASYKEDLERAKRGNNEKRKGE